jgi:spore coat polysaccharide biosynthesis protein SpsF
MKIVATIEARMNSTRLPGKVLKKVCGKPLLELMIERVRRCRRLDDIVIATSLHPSCDAIVDLANEIGINYFRGSEEDVLGRVLGAVKSVGGDVIVELTGDCPLIDPRVVDHLVDEYLTNGADYCANVLKRTYPAGMDTQVFSYAVLEKVAALTEDPSDREHVSLYIYNHPELFSLQNVESDLPNYMVDWRLVVDTAEDFELISRIFENNYPANPTFDLADIRRTLEIHSDWLNLNRHLVKK